ncbi:MAG: DotI/IcmL family type IV secretion protein [Alphaproteobacteria bacterium]
MQVMRSFCFYRILFVVGIFLFAGMPVAHASWLDFFFPPSEKKEPHPSITLKAPFANDDVVFDELDPTGNAELAVPLEERHRPNPEITRWVKEVIPSMLSYSAAGYEEDYVRKIRNFSKVGAEEYVSFLQSYNVVRTLKTGRYDVAGIINDYPIIVNEGAVDGRYRWLYQLRVMLSYFDNNIDVLAGGEREIINQEFTLTVQFGRVKGAENEHGLLIETWDAQKATE